MNYTRSLETPAYMVVVQTGPDTSVAPFILHYTAESYAQRLRRVLPFAFIEVAPYDHAQFMAYTHGCTHHC